MRRISHPEIKNIRRRELNKNNICPLCERVVEEEDAVLDHCHKSGECRGILHRGCNALLGKLENARAINGLTDDALFEVYVSNLFKYIKENRLGIIHPTHRTEREKKELAKKRAKKRARLKKKEQQQVQSRKRESE